MQVIATFGESVGEQLTGFSRHYKTVKMNSQRQNSQKNVLTLLGILCLVDRSSHLYDSHGFTRTINEFGVI